MNKKIVISVVLVFAIALGFVGYKTIFNNSKPETKVAPVINKIDDKGNPTGDTSKVPQHVMDSNNAIQFFNDCMDMSFQIPNTKDEKTMKMVRDYQKENFAPDYISVIEGFYKSYEGLSIDKMQIEKIEKTTLGTPDGKSVPGYSITYKATLKDSTGKTTTIENEGKSAEALVSFIDGKYKLQQFTTNQAKSN